MQGAEADWSFRSVAGSTLTLDAMSLAQGGNGSYWEVHSGAGCNVVKYGQPDAAAILGQRATEPGYDSLSTIQECLQIQQNLHNPGPRPG